MDNLKKLNIIIPDIIAPATKHIDEQIALIKKIEEAGFAYITSDGVYFDTSKLPDYGILSGQNKEEKQISERIEQATEKKNSTDFAL
jgi:cysteinyl-tRNA synthetase